MFRLGNNTDLAWCTTLAAERRPWGPATGVLLYLMLPSLETHLSAGVSSAWASSASLSSSLELVIGSCRFWHHTDILDW